MMSLREARVKAMLTLRELSEMAGVTQETICRIQKGRTPHVSTIRKLSEALKVDPSEVTEFKRALEQQSRGKE